MATFEKRKTAKGETRWRAVVRKEGLIKRKTFATKADAVDWARQTETAIALDDPYVRQPTRSKQSVADLIDYYLRTVMPTKPKSAEAQVPQLLWWKEKIGNQTLRQVAPGDLADLRDELAVSTNKLGKTFAPATVNRYLAAISHVFSLAVKMEWMDRNPMKLVDRLPEPKGRTRFLTRAEKDRLLEACRKSHSRNLYPVVITALSTGMRKEEVQSLTWDHIDFERGRLVLPETKNGEVRVVPLVHKALEVLREHHERRRPDTNLAFPQHKDPQKPSDIRRAFLNALERAKIDNFVFHDTRHTAASYLLMTGASLPEIAAILGHKTLQMVQRYAHLSEAHTASVVERMNKDFLG